jgi:hypothetical protein
MAESDTIYFVVAYLSWFSPLLPIGCIFYKYRRPNTIIGIVLALLVASLASDAVLYYLFINNIPNLSIVNAYMILRFILISFIFFVTWKYHGAPWLISTAIAGILLYFTAIGGFEGRINCILWQVAVLTAVPIILFSLWSLSEIVKAENDLAIFQQYQYWLFAALLMYFFCTLILYLFSEFILTNNASTAKKALWIGHNLVHITYNCMLAWAIIVWKRTKSSSTLSPASP